MTVTQTNRSVVLQGNGSTTNWPYDFLIENALDAEVRITQTATGIETVLAPESYTITDIGNPNGGFVLYPLAGEPLAEGSSLTILRKTRPIQERSITNQTRFRPATAEEAWDYLTLIAQDLRGDVDRSFKAPLGFDGNPELKQGADFAGRVLAIDDNDNLVPGVESSVLEAFAGDFSDGIVINAVGYATGDGVTTKFALPIEVAGTNNVDVIINGDQLYKTEYVAVGFAISFNVAPAPGVSIEFNCKGSLSGVSNDASDIRDFANRTAFVNWVTGGGVLPAGTVVSDGVVQYKAVTDATVISDLPGWVPYGTKTFRHYGMVGDGTTADDAAFIAAMADVQDGERLEAIPGSTYLLNNEHNFLLDDRSITFCFEGATLLMGTEDASITFRAGWSDPIDVGGFSSDGGFIQNADPTAAATLRAKDWVRIYSQDTWARAASGSFRNAQDLYVEGINGGTLDVVRPAYGRLVRMDFTTNPKIVQRSGTTFTVIGGDIRNPYTMTGITNFNSTSLMFVDGFMHPRVINVSSSYAVHPTLEIRACINAVVEGGHDGPKPDRNFSADSGTNALGYGIRDSSTGTRIYNRSAHRTRHAIDTHEQAYGNSADPSKYGSSWGMRAYGCVSWGSTFGSFATHNSCVDVQYHNCEANQSHEAGFGLRGIVSLHHCTSRECRFAYSAFDQSASNPSNTIVSIHDHTSIACGYARNQVQGRPLNIYNDTHLEAYHQQSVFIVNSFPECETVLHGTTFIQPCAALADNQVTTPLFGNLNHGTFRFDTMIWDLTTPFQNQSGTEVFPQVLDVRNINDGFYDYRMIGKTMYAMGAAAKSFLRTSGNPIEVDQLSFNLCFDDGVGVWNAVEQQNQTNIAIVRLNDMQNLGRVNVMSKEAAFSGNPTRYETAAFNFGASVANQAVVTVTATVNGINGSATYDVRHIGHVAGVEVIGMTTTADDTVSATIRNISGSTSNLSAVNLRFSIMATDGV